MKSHTASPLLVLGHRGCRQNPNFYENSHAAHMYASKVANGFETDIVLTPDDVVLIHDTLFTDKVYYELAHHMDEPSQALLVTQPQQPPYLYKLPKDVVDRLLLKDGSKIPRLRDTLTQLCNQPNVTVNLELKGPGTWEPALQMVDEFVASGRIKTDQIIFSSFNHYALVKLRQSAQDKYKIGCLYAREAQTLSPTFGNWPDLSDEDKKGAYVPFNLQVLLDPILKHIQPDFFNLERSAVRVDTINAITSAFPGAKVIIWTAGEKHPCDNDELVKTVLQAHKTGKLHAVITGFPEELIRILYDADIPVNPNNLLNK